MPCFIRLFYFFVVCRDGIDNLLLKQAKQQGKTIVALERLQPLYLMQSIPEDKILRSLDRVILQHQAILAEQKKLVSLYQTNQAQALWQEVSEIGRAHV